MRFIVLLCSYVVMHIIRVHYRLLSLAVTKLIRFQTFPLRRNETIVVKDWLLNRPTDGYTSFVSFRVIRSVHATGKALGWRRKTFVVYASDISRNFDDFVQETIASCVCCYSNSRFIALHHADGTVWWCILWIALRRPWLQIVFPPDSVLK
jgi:hypothetical protein